jgi:two-component system LytT family sensor kinase
MPERLTTDAPARGGARSAAMLAALWTVPGVLSSVETYVFQSMEARRPIFWKVALVQCSGWWAWALMTPLVFAIARRYPVRRPVSAGTIGVHAAAAVAAALSHALIYTMAGVALIGAPPQTSIVSLYLRNVLGWSVLSVLVYVGLVSAGHWMDLAARDRAREQRTLALEAQLAGAQLQALRMQLHPHFLFNTLNTIAILVREQDVTTSVRLITQLGDVLRQVLRSPQTQEVPLRDELAFTRQYLEIEEVRFADRLIVSYMLEDGAQDALVPHLILQPLVENALRHGIARREGAGLLEIGAKHDGDRLVLWVRDNGPGLSSGAPAAGEGIGLANVRARLAALYRGGAALTLESLPVDDGGGVRATIVLPCLAAAPAAAVVPPFAEAHA